MFWIGLIPGVFIGACAGIVIMALCRGVASIEREEETRSRETRRLIEQAKLDL